jgi:hypothetical protein
LEPQIDEMTESPPTTSLAEVRTEIAYYSRLADDRSGSVMQHIIRSFGYAYIKHQTYMGACGETQLKHMTAHKYLLESIGLDQILPFACPPQDDKVENPNGVKAKMMALWESREETLMKEVVQNPGWFEYHPHITYLKQHLAYLPASDIPLIAVHIRRGDISPCCVFARYLPNSYYHTVIESHLESLPNAKVVIFTEKKSFESLTSFVDKGYHLDIGGDLGMVWKTMISADVIIGSKSSFSDVPKLLARGSIGNDPWNLDEKLLRLVQEEKQRLKKTCKKTCTFDDDSLP